MIKTFVYAIFIFSLCQPLYCQNATTNKPTSVTTNAFDPCTGNGNLTCEDCLKNSKCFFCDADNQCKTFKSGFIFPENCAASKARWLDCPFCCSLDFQAIIIAACVVGAVLILVVTCCLCYCFNKTCKAISDRNITKIERRITKQRAQMKERHEARSAERKERNEAIRVKYGLRPSTYAKIEE